MSRDDRNFVAEALAAARARAAASASVINDAPPVGEPIPDRPKNGNGGAHRGGHYGAPPTDSYVGRAGEEAPGKDRRFTLVRFNQVLLDTAAPYLVKDLIPAGGMIVVWGPPKCGKSFWVFDLMMHLAVDRIYRGRRVKAGAVVYLALEGGRGFVGRIEAWKLRHEVADAPFYLVRDRCDLVRDHKALIAEISDQLGFAGPLDTIDLTNAPAVVVIDTLNRSLAGSESKDEDMSAYIQAADAIRETFRCAVIIVHHCGVDGKRPRGHTSLEGACDAQIAVARDPAGNIVATVEWMKDGEEGAVIASKLEIVELGQDEDGEQITSCLVVPAEETAQAKPAAKPKGWPKPKLTAMRALRKAIDEVGQVPPASNNIPPHVRVVSEEDWRKYAYAMGLSTGGERAQQIAFKNAHDWLIGSGHVDSWMGSLWPAAKD